MSRMQTAQARLSERLHDRATTTVTYRRAAASVSISAVLGGNLLKVTDAAGITTIVRPDLTADFIASELILSGSVTTPARGDYIDVSLSSVTRRYEVMPFESEPEWRYLDPWESSVRANAKYIGTV